MAFRSSMAVRNASADASRVLIDAGSGSGYIKIFSGPQPASPAIAATGTLLAGGGYAADNAKPKLMFSKPAFGVASSGVITAAPVTDDLSVLVTGVAGWFRIYDSNNVALWDGKIGVTADITADMKFETTAWAEGGIVTITSMTITWPMSCE